MTPTTADQQPSEGNAIARYSKAQPPKPAAICRLLHAEIEAALPDATSRIWHAIPVWFIGDNPVVGYKATPKQVNLLFWNGQSFGEPALKAAGKFKAAQIQFSDQAEIDVRLLRRWLRKARTDICDYRGLIKARRADA
jgi:hypothetical protein